MTKLPNYNPDGKKLTWAQHMEKKRKAEEAEKLKLKQNKGETPGRCSVCDCSKFTLKCSKEHPGKLERTCQQCEDKRYF